MNVEQVKEYMLALDEISGFKGKAKSFILQEALSGLEQELDERMKNLIRESMDSLVPVKEKRRGRKKKQEQQQAEQDQTEAEKPDPFIMTQ